MRSLIKKIYNRFSNRNKNNVNIESICNNPSNDLNSYCSMEYTYIKKDNI